MLVQNKGKNACNIVITVLLDNKRAAFNTMQYARTRDLVIAAAGNQLFLKQVVLVDKDLQCLLEGS